jgi:hypothetical protein
MRTAGGFRYAGRGITSFRAQGYAGCAAEPTHDDPKYRTPTGPLASVVRCRTGAMRVSRPVTLSWTLTYD